MADATHRADGILPGSRTTDALIAALDIDGTILPQEHPGTEPQNPPVPARRHCWFVQRRHPPLLPLLVNCPNPQSATARPYVPRGGIRIPQTAERYAQSFALPEPVYDRQGLQRAIPTCGLKSAPQCSCTHP